MYHPFHLLSLFRYDKKTVAKNDSNGKILKVILIYQYHYIYYNLLIIFCLIFCFLNYIVHTAGVAKIEVVKFLLYLT